MSSLREIFQNRFLAGSSRVTPQEVHPAKDVSCKSSYSFEGIVRWCCQFDLAHSQRRSCEVTFNFFNRKPHFSLRIPVSSNSLGQGDFETLVTNSFAMITPWIMSLRSLSTLTLPKLYHAEVTRSDLHSSCVHVWDSRDKKLMVRHFCK